MLRKFLKMFSFNFYYFNCFIFKVFDHCYWESIYAYYVVYYRDLRQDVATLHVHYTAFNIFDIILVNNLIFSSFTRKKVMNIFDSYLHRFIVKKYCYREIYYSLTDIYLFKLQHQQQQHHQHHYSLLTFQINNFIWHICKHN